MFRMACQPGSSERPNEDWAGGSVGTGGALAVVLDGVTTPGDTGCMHGTPWYVDQLGRQLLLRGAGEAPLMDILADSIMAVAETHADTCDLKHRGTPAAAVAMVRLSNHGADYLVLADATVVLGAGAGAVETITDSRVDAVTSKDAALVLRHPIGTNAHSERLQRMSTNQQLHRNREGGYWVAAGMDADAAHQAVAGTAGSIDRIALLSDGAARTVDIFHRRTWTDVLDLLQTSGPEALIDEVRELEDLDRNGKEWPRFKCSDDAACAFIAADTPSAGGDKEGWTMRNTA